MRVRFSPRAIRDLNAIADYIRQHNPAAALKVRAAILASIETLTLFPYAGRKQSTEGCASSSTSSISRSMKRPMRSVSSRSDMQHASAIIVTRNC